jgi:RES domain-containing protein
VRFRGLAWRAHDPRWAFKPLSGDGAAIHGGRFNPPGVPALYLALDPMTAIKEISQGFAHKFEPCVLCTYEIDCADIVDLRSEEGRAAAGALAEDMACAWFAYRAKRHEAPSQRLARRLMDRGAAGVLVPSYVGSAATADQNCVLWKWSDKRPHKVAVFDPGGKLPKDQLSWG